MCRPASRCARTVSPEVLEDDGLSVSNVELSFSEPRRSSTSFESDWVIARSRSEMIEQTIVILYLNDFVRRRRRRGFDSNWLLFSRFGRLWTRWTFLMEKIRQRWRTWFSRHGSDVGHRRRLRKICRGVILVAERWIDIHRCQLIGRHGSTLKTNMGEHRSDLSLVVHSRDFDEEYSRDWDDWPEVEEVSLMHTRRFLVSLKSRSFFEDLLPFLSAFWQWNPHLNIPSRLSIEEEEEDENRLVHGG